MSKKTVITKEHSTSILPLLGLLFIGLKLTENIEWSWWWVLAPFWAPLVLGLVLLVFVVVISAISKG